MTSGRVAFAIEDRGQFAAGDSFGPSGAYERLVGKVEVRVDPTSVPEGSIADLELAPSDEDGLIGCTADFMILKPVDLGRANGRLFFDYGNRGNKRALQFFNDAAHTNNPLTRSHAGAAGRSDGAHDDHLSAGPGDASAAADRRPAGRDRAARRGSRRRSGHCRGKDEGGGFRQANRRGPGQKMTDLPHAHGWRAHLDKAHAAPRCGAKRRDGGSCTSPAMPNGRCRMHGA